VKSGRKQQELRRELHLQSSATECSNVVSCQTHSRSSPVSLHSATAPNANSWICTTVRTWWLPIVCHCPSYIGRYFQQLSWNSSPVQYKVTRREKHLATCALFCQRRNGSVCSQRQRLLLTVSDAFFGEIFSRWDGFSDVTNHNTRRPQLPFYTPKFTLALWPKDEIFETNSTIRVLPSVSPWRIVDDFYRLHHIQDQTAHVSKSERLYISQLARSFFSGRGR
jgi:hypothetical protein